MEELLYTVAIVSAVGISGWYLYHAQQTKIMRYSFGFVGAGFLFAAGLLFITLMSMMGVTQIPNRFLLHAFPALILTEVIVFSVIGYRIFYNVQEPVKELEIVMSNVSKGDMDTYIPTTLKQREDELGELSRSFDRLLSSLKLAMNRNNASSKTS